MPTHLRNGRSGGFLITLCQSVLAVVALCLVPSTSQAQTANRKGVERFERQLDRLFREGRVETDEQIPLGQRLYYDAGGYLSFYVFHIDDADAEGHVLRQTSLTGYGQISLGETHDLFVRVRTSYRDWNDGDSFNGLGDDFVEPELERAVYTVDLNRAFSGQEAAANTGVFQTRARLGRQLVHWGQGLSLSRVLDSAQIHSVIDQKLHLNFLAGTTIPSSTDIDSSRPDFDTDTLRGFFGGMIGYQVHPRHRPYVYGLVQRDFNDQDSAVFNIDGVSFPTEYKYDSFYIGLGIDGSITDNLAYGAEFVYQGGSTLSNSFIVDNTGTIQPVDQSDDDISAYAFDASLDYFFRDANRSRLTAGITVASGDDDRFSSSTDTFGGNQPGTTDNAFNGFGFLDTGLAFVPNVSNLLLFRVGGSFFPVPNQDLLDELQVGGHLYVFNKLDSDGPIDEATDRGNRYLGLEPNLFANWQLTSDLGINLRYGVFLPSHAFTDREARHFLAAGVTLGF